MSNLPYRHSSQDGAAMPLSDEDLDKFLVSFEIPIVEYNDLPNYNTLADLFQTKNCVVIFNANPEVEIGHWTLLLCYDSTRYEFFDSLTGVPDKIQSIWGGTGQAHIRDLLERSRQSSDSSVDLFFNDTILQSKTAQTCGRWILDRILKMKMNCDEYYKYYDFIKQNYRKRLDLWIVKSLAIPL